VEFVSSRELRINPGPVWKRLEEGVEVVVTSRGRPVALLLGVSGEDVEDTLRALRRARAEMAVSRMRGDAARRGLGGMGQEDIEDEIKAVRRGHSER
jgi:prevent-host-death family protein